MLDGAAGHRKVDDVHGLVVVQHGVDQAAGESVAAAHAVQDVEGEQLALEGMAVQPHEGFQAVLAAAVGIADVPRDALEVGVAVDEVLEHFVLLLVAGLQGHAVFPVALGVVVLVLPQVVGLDAQQHVHIGQAFGAEVAGLLPAPQAAAEVAVKADGQPLRLGHLQQVHGQGAAVGGQRRGDAAQVQPVVAVQQGVQVHAGEVVLGDGAVLAVVGDFRGADAVAGLQIIGAQTVGGHILLGGQDHGGAVDVVGAQPAHRALAQAVVGHHAEEGAVHAEVGQGQGDVGLAAAIAGFKAGGHADLLVVRRGQAEHDLAAGDEFGGVAVGVEQRVVVFHEDSSLFYRWQDAAGLPHDTSCIHYIAFCPEFQAGLPKWPAAGCRIFVKSTVHLVETACVRPSDRAKVLSQKSRPAGMYRWAVCDTPLHAGQVKVGGVFLFGAALLLHIAAGQPFVHRIVDDPAVLVGGDAPADALFRRLVKGGVLAHQAGDEAAGGGVVPGGHLVQHGETVLHLTRQGQMPQDDPLLQKAVLVKDGAAGLGHHGLDGGFGHLEVIGRGREPGRQGRGDVFQVGQPDVHIALPAPDAVQRLVTAGVADDGQAQPAGPRLVQRGDDPGLPLPRRDQVDVVGALALQVEEDFRQAPDADLLAKALGADGVVLAVAAFEGAAREKDGAAAAGPADAGLLPEMEGGAGHFERAGSPAEPGPPGGPVGPAAAGAEGAMVRDGVRCWHSA